MIDVALSSDQLDLSEVQILLAKAEFGAENYFLGSIRDNNNDKKVEGVFFEVQEMLARKVLSEIAAEAAAQHDDLMAIVVRHRLGFVRVGELSTIVAVSTRHRAAAFEYSRYIIDEIKKRVPIWKQEYYVGGEAEWLKGNSLRNRTDCE